VQLAAMIRPNSVSYPISSHGPSGLEIALGVVWLGIMLVATAPRIGNWAVPRELRVGAAIWLVGWLPVSHLIMPLQMVTVADRYMLFPTLGLALFVSAGVVRIRSDRLRALLVAVIAISAALRTTDARANWAMAETLWQRATEANPSDGGAWSMYAEAIFDTGDRDHAARVVEEGLRYSDEPRLIMRKALLALDRGARADGIKLMRGAAEAGEYRAMTNLAYLLLQHGSMTEALGWARRSAARVPLYANGQRVLGMVALEAKLPDEALRAFERAYALEPRRLENRFNLGLALLALHRDVDAQPHLEACLQDPMLGPRARALLDQRR
jgi:tetratricopeptide (TPR) repeat protein